MIVLCSSGSRWRCGSPAASPRRRPPDAGTRPSIAGPAPPAGARAPHPRRVARSILGRADLGLADRRRRRRRADRPGQRRPPPPRAVARRRRRGVRRRARRRDGPRHAPAGSSCRRSRSPPPASSPRRWPGSASAPDDLAGDRSVWIGDGTPGGVQRHRARRLRRPSTSTSAASPTTSSRSTPASPSATSACAPPTDVTVEVRSDVDDGTVRVDGERRRRRRRPDRARRRARRDRRRPGRSRRRRGQPRTTCATSPSRR